GSLELSQSVLTRRAWHGGSRSVRAGIAALSAPLADPFADGGRNWPQVPDQSAKRHQFQHVKSQIEFPPIESLAHGRRIMMMIIVPAFAQGDDRQPYIVAAGVARPVPLAAE